MAGNYEKWSEQYGEDFATYYDQLMDDVDIVAWTEYLLGWMDRSFPGVPRSELRVMDAACGTGNLSIPLAKAGCAVTATDSSEGMLRVAAEKARKEGVSIYFAKQSLSDLTAHRPFDVVNCACDGVNYLVEEGEATAFFRAARRILKPGGMLLFDVSSVAKLQGLAGRCIGEDRDDIAYFWQNDWEVEGRVLQMDISFFAAEKNQNGMPLFRRFQETHWQRAYTAEELVGMLREAGFGDVWVCAFLSDEAPEIDDDRIQFVARKPR